MQTFLPYPDFNESAVVLDKKRQWKQVVEASQILDVLEGRKTGWANHPAVKMWVGYTDSLRDYFNAMLYVTKTIHHINTKYEFRKPDRILNEYPWWLGNTNFHFAMRARLIEKDRDFYLPLFPAAEGFNGGKYLWPDMETKTFKTI